MQSRSIPLAAGLLAALTLSAPVAPVQASSHMDAPLITFDDPANTTDVYAFLSKENGVDYLTTALAVYPFEEPGIGPNNYRFDDRVRYEIHLSLGDDVAKGKKSITYRFDFDTEFKNRNTILQSYLGVLDGDVDGFDPNQNMRQSYTVTKIDYRGGDDKYRRGDGDDRDDDDDDRDDRHGRGDRDKDRKVLGRGLVPPNNQGQVTPFYNLGNDGDRPAKEGVAKRSDLDRYTRSAITELKHGYRVFAGQRDDGFYADIQSIFDLEFSFGRTDGTPTKPFDSQGGFNVHTIVLDIPLSELGDATLAGVHATTSRQRITKLSKKPGKKATKLRGKFIQVGRQGNPLFAEALVAQIDKDLYNQTEPRDDDQFAIYAKDPDGDEGIEISRLLGVTPPIPGLVEAIYIPDVIKVDLTTGPARTPNDPEFHRLGFFGGDMLQSKVQDPFGNGGLIPGGWPNGRRFGDDVVDVAFIAVGIPAPEPVDPGIGPDYDRVISNDITYNDVFPYAATPLNGRNHGHHGEPAVTN